MGSLTSCSQSLGFSQNRWLAPQTLYSAIPNFSALPMSLLRLIPSSITALIALAVTVEMFYRFALSNTVDTSHMWLLSRAIEMELKQRGLVFKFYLTSNLNRYRVRGYYIGQHRSSMSFSTCACSIYFSFSPNPQTSSKLSNLRVVLGTSWICNFPR